MKGARWVVAFLMIVVWILSQPSPLHAACDRFPLMNRLIGFWEQSQRDDGLTIAQAGATYDIISNADFADVLQRLRIADQGVSYGNAMQLIADMSRLSALALADQPEAVRGILQDPQIAARVNILKTELSGRCNQPGGADATTDNGGGLITSRAQGGDQDSADTPGKPGMSDAIDPQLALRNAPLGGTSRSGGAASDLKGLGLVVGFLLVLCTIVVIVHLTLLALRALRRYRKTCKVPAVLSLSILDVSGHIFVAGRYGCAFTPDEELDEDALSIMSMGTYCQITAGRQTFYAKLLRDASDTVGLRFSDPAEVADLKELFSHSVTKPKFDLTGTVGSYSRPFSFGEGRMIRP